MAIKLFDNPQEQQAVWRGLRRLLLLNIPSPISICTRNYRIKPSLGSAPLTRTAKCWI
ncbi:hypothetical protein LNP74_21885 [Klebsiella pneumoniae subsp. pneumoniae]|nr:hypothetical protein [Klebsiella pneumoniae subsp. pneumoniae]